MNVFQSLLSSSAANLYTVNDGASRIMIECGAPLRRIRPLVGWCMADIVGCLVTHFHADHSRGAKEVLAAGIDLYCSVETAEALSLGGHRLHIVRPREPFDVGTWRVVAFPTHHDCPGSLGFLLASGWIKLLFACDTFYVHEQFQGLTHVCLEANYSERTLAPDLDPAVKKRLFKSHFSLENVIKFLMATDLSRVVEIHLLHLSDGNSDEAYFLDEVRKATGEQVFVAGKG